MSLDGVTEVLQFSSLVGTAADSPSPARPTHPFVGLEYPGFRSTLLWQAILNTKRICVSGVLAAQLDSTDSRLLVRQGLQGGQRIL